LDTPAQISQVDEILYHNWRVCKLLKKYSEKSIKSTCPWSWTNESASCKRGLEEPTAGAYERLLGKQKRRWNCNIKVGHRLQ
jgi:hypothetical protein